MNPPLGRLQSQEGSSLGGGLVAGFRSALQRLLRAPIAGDAPLRLEARLNLGPKKSLMLVNCCGRRVLLAVSGDTIVPVADVPKTARSKAAVGKEAAR
jgi:flagellar biogenesis protein FliO